MTDQLILPSTPAAGVRVLALNRPSKRNALSQDLITVFLEHLHSASKDDGVRVIVITGSTTFFCAGADIGEISRLDAEEARKCRYLSDLCSGMQAVRKPLIAAVEGMAVRLIAYPQVPGHAVLIVDSSVGVLSLHSW
jgi:enoyl-CoA hydratase